MIALAIAVGAAIALGLALLRLLAGPTLHDRALAARSAIMRAMLVTAALAVAAGEAAWLDVGFALAFAALLLLMAMLKVFRTGTFQAPLARSGEDA